MEHDLALTNNMLVATAILVVAYVFIFSEMIHRTSAAIIGAVVMIGTGMVLGFYSQEAAITSVDINTILLLAAMMVLVSMLRGTGAFEYSAIIIARLAKGDPRLLLIYLSLAVSLISMILDNVTTVIVFAPLTILITRIIKLNPMPYLMAEAILSNVGGIATLVGDPPNIMIGSAAKIDFTSFLVHMAPPVSVIWLFTVLFLLFVFRHQLSPTETDIDPNHLDLKHAIKDRAGLIRVLVSLGTVVVLFFIHHHFHFYPSYAAFIGLALALLLMQPKPEQLFGEINWSVLAFFCGLFVIVGGVEATGLLHLLGQQLAEIAKQPELLLMTAIMLMWVAAVMSAVVDNIPFTVTMIPIIAGLEASGAAVAPLWWALALGVGLGGNSTHIGSTANIIAFSELEQSGIKGAAVSPLGWMRVGVPTTIIGLIIASSAFALFFEFFGSKT
ncbi:MAG: ArsB/NhaD family transporter [Chromatiales bacterium]|jgi:Na+/H+ antiporter NhaD/arsenite permease-like protein